jgi:hypothetical protein
MAWHLRSGMERFGPRGATRPGFRRSIGPIFGLAIANVLGTGVQLISDSLDPAHGLVAVDVAQVVSCERLKFIQPDW